VTVEHEILTLEEVARYLRVSERTVYEWAQKGEIPCGKLGTSWRFKRSEIEKWVDERLQRPKPARDGAVLIEDVLTPERVQLLHGETKEDILNRLVDVLGEAPEVQNVHELREEVFEREKLMSTGIGMGVGVPHVRLGSVQRLVMAVGVNAVGLADYQSLDEQPVRVVCLVAAHQSEHAQYLKTLAAISSLLKHEGTRAALLEAETAERVYEILTQDS